MRLAALVEQEAKMMQLSHTFEHTLAKSRKWVDEVGQELGLDDPDRSLRALRAGLHALRDWLPSGEAIALGAQLPMLIRGLYYEGWRLARHPHGRARESIYSAVREELAGDSITATDAMAATMVILARHVSSGEIDHIVHVLPRPIANLWLDARR